MAELAGMVTGATLNDWRPDDTFFDLLGSKDVLHAMLKDIASSSIAESNKDEASKVKKGIIKDYMRGANGREHKADWLPPYFQFPIKSYTDKGGIAVAAKWQSVAASIGI